MTQLRIDYTAAAPATPGRDRLWLRTVRMNLHRIAGWAVFFCVVAFALVKGLELRRWAWDQTEPIRYVMDINNAFRQGTLALRGGYVDRYDEDQTSGESHGQPMGLDYAPGRLAIATLWTGWVRNHLGEDLSDPRRIRMWPELFYAHARRLGDPYELVKPMLMLNLTGEIFSAIAMFFLVRRYTSGKPPDLHRVRGNILGLLAALFFWFDPALIWNAHCWPQWDSWVLPFFLWAVLLASWDWWFCSGVLIATGAMFKGQILFGSPVFMLWPLFQGRLPALARWIVGLMTATAAITAVWLLRVPGTNPTGDQFVPGHVSDNAITWLVYLALLFAAMPAALCWPGNRYTRIPVALLLGAILTWVIGGSDNRHFLGIGLIAWPIGFWYADELLEKWPLPAPVQRWTWLARSILGCLMANLLIYPPLVLEKEWLVIVVITSITIVTLLAFVPHRALPLAAVGWKSVALLLCIPITNSGHGLIIGYVAITISIWYLVAIYNKKWPWQARLPLVWLAIALLIYPVWVLAKDWLLLVVIATIGMATLLAVAPRRALPFAAAGWMSAALLLCVPIFNTSHGWFDLGFGYGTYHYERIANGQIDNLPELLKDRWGWDDLMAPAVTLPAGPTADHVADFINSVEKKGHLELGQNVDLPLKYFLVFTWLAAAVLCAIGVAIHDRNRSPRFLIGIAAPWIVFFAVMTQMHQRYLLWGASLSSAAAVLNPGFAMLHLFLSCVSASQEMQSMMNNQYDPANHGQYTHYALYQFIDSWHPGVAWAVLLSAAIFVYATLKTDRRGSVPFMTAPTPMIVPSANTAPLAGLPGPDTHTLSTVDPK